MSLQSFPNDPFTKHPLTISHLIYTSFRVNWLQNAQDPIKDKKYLHALGSTLFRNRKPLVLIWFLIREKPGALFCFSQCITGTRLYPTYYLVWSGAWCSTFLQTWERPLPFARICENTRRNWIGLGAYQEFFGWSLPGQHSMNERQGQLVDNFLRPLQFFPYEDQLCRLSPVTPTRRLMTTLHKIFE